MRSRRSKSATSSGLAKCKSLHTLISSPNVATSRCLEFTKNIIKPRFGNTYRTFLRAMNTDTSVIERLERERDERELCKLRDKNSLTQSNK